MQCVFSNGDLISILTWPLWLIHVDFELCSSVPHSVPGSCILVFSELLKWCFIIPSAFCSTQQDVALTTENPEKCTILARLYDMYPQSKKRYWYLIGNEMRHSGQRKVFNINVWGLHVGQSVGLLVSRDGDLHLFVDGEYRKMIWSGLPTDQPLWGVADVYGKCAKIKADILCGEWWSNQHPVSVVLHIISL